MSHLQFEDNEGLNTQPISDEETRQIISLWAEEHAQREREASQPSAQAIGEALGIPSDEVLRLLQRVRRREAQVRSSQYAVPLRRRRNAVGLWFVGLALALVACVVLLRAMRSSTPIATAPAAVAETYAGGAGAPVTVSGSGTHYVRSADGSVTLESPSGYHYERRADGSLTIVGPEGTYKRSADGSVGISGPGGRYTRRADGSEERTGNPPERITPPDPPPGVTLPEVP